MASQTTSHSLHNNDPRSRARNAFDLVASGGVGSPSPIPSPPSASPSCSATYKRLAEYGPTGERSLAGIALRAFLLGVVLVLFLAISLATLCYTRSPAWRAPLFITTLSVFHFLEFWTTAEYNTGSASISSFLLSSNGSAYTTANVSALLECLITTLIFPDRHWLPRFISHVLTVLGLLLLVSMQVIRSTAMIHAGKNFNHIVAHHKSNTHQLVSDGIYSIWRHPSYFGYYWWGLGTQLMMGNVVCFVGYAVVLWRFFSVRIRVEEERLVEFFGDDYVQYRKRTRIGIPFI
ncbi:Isoprenylcysteine carboxyl methyltransferase family-domain-containing protein [Calycina marina]|uniref:Protein-S-isoprenylcysteine O-methyltransferase n=1 Tax=Calycina marina TaxID=1763456 RepID=A0A9P7Z1F0_9HELO|nr:Isoprenylcysteine carboxyl methyltransferase family-domain-containing protein [Calycina marina]